MGAPRRVADAGGLCVATVLLDASPLDAVLLAESTPVWQFAVTTAVALLAGGGLAAWGTLYYKRRIKIEARMYGEPTPLYTWSQPAKQLVLRPTPNLDLVQPGTPHRAFAPVLKVDITNASEREVSVNELRWRFSLLDEEAPAGPGPARVVVRYQGEAGAQQVVERSRGLVPVAQQGPFVTYLVEQDAAPQFLKAMEQDPLVALAVLDAEGAADSEWTVQETVDLLVGEQDEYVVPVNAVVPANGSLTVPQRLGSTRSVRGTAELSVLLNSTRRAHIGRLDMRLHVPAFVRLTTRSGEAGT